MKTKNKRVFIQLSPEILAKAAKMAEKKGLTVNMMLSVIITEVINNGVVK